MGKDARDSGGTSGGAGWKPVLGLSDEPAGPVDWREWAGKTIAGTVFAQPEPAELIELTVIVPARDEENCLGACLQSLVSQSEEIFKLGKDWELIVVDDHSSDRTAKIAREFSHVTVMEAGKLEPGWTGKANAIWTAAQHGRGRWLLFTDADTLHEPGNLRRAMHEAERHKAGMLSYSPRQIVRGLAQRSLMPLVFCELALAYPPAKVSDPYQRIAAANGQFLLVEREAYRKLGGHASVADKVLEDVELAYLAKRRRVGKAGNPRRQSRANGPGRPHNFDRCGLFSRGADSHSRQPFKRQLAERGQAGSRPFLPICGCRRRTNRGARFRPRRSAGPRSRSRSSFGPGLRRARPGRARPHPHRPQLADSKQVTRVPGRQ